MITSTNLDLLVCSTCGQQTDRSGAEQFDIPPGERSTCKVCDDPRQYVPASGQQWTTLRKLQEDRENEYHNEITPVIEGQDDLLSIVTKPTLAIGQRAVLYRSAKHGNILWDCITYLDDDTIERIRELGGIKTIAISHPHFYSSAITWAQVFQADLWLHESDKEWLLRKPSERVKYWSGTQTLIPDAGDGQGAELVTVAGHFPGSAVLHLHEKRAILTADSITVVPSGGITLMWSYPNMVSYIQKWLSARLFRLLPCLSLH